MVRYICVTRGGTVADVVDMTLHTTLAAAAALPHSTARRPLRWLACSGSLSQRQSVCLLQPITLFPYRATFPAATPPTTLPHRHHLPHTHCLTPTPTPARARTHPHAPARTHAHAAHAHARARAPRTAWTWTVDVVEQMDHWFAFHAATLTPHTAPIPTFLSPRHATSPHFRAAVTGTHILRAARTYLNLPCLRDIAPRAALLSLHLTFHRVARAHAPLRVCARTRLRCARCRAPCALAYLHRADHPPILPAYAVRRALLAPARAHPAAG